jgi:hypothetical protein
MISGICAILLHANVVKQQRQFSKQVSISLTWSLIYNHTHHTDTCSYNTVILSSCFVSVLTCTDFHFSLDMNRFWWHSHNRRDYLKGPCMDGRTAKWMSEKWCNLLVIAVQQQLLAPMAAKSLEVSCWSVAGLKELHE